MLIAVNPVVGFGVGQHHMKTLPVISGPGVRAKTPVRRPANIVWSSVMNRMSSVPFRNDHSISVCDREVWLTWPAVPVWRPQQLPFRIPGLQKGYRFDTFRHLDF
jgi:hypothetical protein